MRSDLELGFLRELEHIVEQHAARTRASGSQTISTLEDLASALTKTQELIESEDLSAAKELLRACGDVFESLTAVSSDTIEVPHLKLQFAVLKAQMARLADQ